MIEVATGRMYLSAPGDTCHGQPIPNDHNKVQIDSVIEECRLYRLPVPVADLTELHEAVGSFVLWPRYLIAEATSQVYLKELNFFY